MKLTKEIIEELKLRGVSTLLQAGSFLPDDSIFEPPCSFKWMAIHHSIRMGAFSYAVSGFYFGCNIGRYCSFGEHVQIGRHPHPIHWASTSPFFYSNYDHVLDQPAPENSFYNPSIDFKKSTPPTIAKKTEIGNDVWIGHGAFILPGVKIGHGAVIAGMSVVTKDIPPYAVAGGNPAKIIKFRFPEDQVKKLLLSNWWDFAPWQLKGINMDDIDLFTDHINQIRNDTTPHQPKLISINELTQPQ